METIDCGFQGSFKKFGGSFQGGESKMALKISTADLLNTVHRIPRRAMRTEQGISE